MHIIQEMFGTYIYHLTVRGASEAGIGGKVREIREREGLGGEL